MRALDDIWNKSIGTNCVASDLEPLKNSHSDKGTNCNTINFSAKSFNSVQTETVPKVLEYKATQTKDDAKDLEIRRLKKIIQKTKPNQCRFEERDSALEERKF